MNEAQNQRRALLFAKKNQFRNWWRKSSQKYQENWAWLSRRVKRLRNLWPFHYVLFLLEGTKLNVSWLKIISQFIWMSELDPSLCRQRVWIPTIIIREIYEEKQKVCSPIHELERWFWRKASWSETDYTYILAKRIRGKFYLPSIGFPQREHLRAKKVNTNTNRGSAAKSYQENWAWKTRRVKWLRILWPFQSLLFLLEGRKHKNS